jgi:hypothetical protein
MKAIKAIYRNGKVTFTEKPSDPGPVEVVVVFPESSDDPWASIVAEKTLRHSFAKYAQESMKEIRAGKGKPLKVRDL